MGFFNIFRNNDGHTADGQNDEPRGMIDVIRYNGETDELVWKFPYDNLSTGAQLIVNQSQEALFYKGGMIADVFGPGKHTLSSENLPVLQKLVNLPFGGKTPFVAEVWFVNKTVRRNLTFGTPVPIELLDPLYGVNIPVRSFGEFGIQVQDSSAFLTQMVGTQHITTTADIEEQFGSMIVRKLSSCISKYIVQQKVSVVQLSTLLDDVSTYVKNAISEEFATYGLRIVNFDVMSINFDKEDPNVAQILEAQTQASAMDFESAALARKRQREGYTYQQERQLDVLETAAGNTGSAGTMLGAGMGLGMGVGLGGAFGQQMGQVTNVMNEGPQLSSGATVPPPPVDVAYHLNIGGVTTGPFNMDQLQQKIGSGELTTQTYVWKAGMANWAAAGTITELQGLFAPQTPPAAPTL